jgi:hypothetical protein
MIPVLFPLCASQGKRDFIRLFVSAMGKANDPGKFKTESVPLYYLSPGQDALPSFLAIRFYAFEEVVRRVLQIRPIKKRGTGWAPFLVFGGQDFGGPPPWSTRFQIRLDIASTIPPHLRTAATKAEPAGEPGPSPREPRGVASVMSEAKFGNNAVGNSLGHLESLFL